MKTMLRLSDRQAEADRVMTFGFAPDDPFAHQAGQYLRLTIPHAAPDDRGSARYFTISSAPGEPLLTVTTRLSEPGSTFKRALAELPIGAAVEASGPLGRFTYPPDRPPAVFLAGGIGITPFRSILVDLGRRGESADVVLLYANRDADFPFRARLDGLWRVLPELRIVYTVTRSSFDWHGAVGRIDAEFLARHVPDLSRRTAYASGPRPMVESVAEALTSLGVDPAQIKAEIFPGYDS